MSREIDQLVRRVERLGYTVVRNGSAHLKVVGGDGELLVTLPATPSDHRSLKNAVAVLRRAGIDVRHQRRRKGSMDERSAENLRRRLEAAISSGTGITELARLATRVGEEKRLRTFASSHSGEVTISRIRRGGGVTKWVFDLLGATLNELGRPGQTRLPVEEAEDEETFDIDEDLVQADWPKQDQVRRAETLDDWMLAFDSLERTIKLFRAATRRTLER